MVHLRDSALIDALDALPPRSFSGTVWRVASETRDPCQCSASGGRWDDKTFDVLYTSLEKEGALAEMYFHLLRGQPVFPSKVRFKLYELHVELSQVLDLGSLDDLTALGLDPARYKQLSYEERVAEYPRSQEIAEVAHFLDIDGLMVPSARRACSNLVVFCDRSRPDAIEIVNDHGLIDWAMVGKPVHG
ncbi:RES family NAD+ phosphorylase [Rhizobium sp. SSA_523]|uniref:RES family NAD+ phosphorylase n=1 Tax=Rhizobium sp. SSA_523 TaxID=2952477 RepID=UPI0020902833|nr:RES family NAD+ phosphorylase [Rhizobium sp. SSA_523]MCO5730962.1 RES family NAD+ phosphorylase [Rhizobium sp. SSA_523]WKC24229.1 RES family NAD+ phosphorylase [Rhizobium sp. SSA_523]